MPDPKTGWGWQLAAEVERLSAAPVDTVHLRFYPWGARAESYLEALLARGPFDAVVISATKGGFTTFSTHDRVRRLAGRRAGEWFLRAATHFDARTRWGKAPGLTLSVNQLAHRLAGRTIGQAPPTTLEEATQGYMRAFTRLARLEDTRVVVVVAPGLPAAIAARRPALRQQVE